MLLRQAGGGEGRDGVLTAREWPLHLPHHSISHVRLHDQLHQQAQALTREVHDEQCAGELYDTTGNFSNDLS